MFHRDLQVEFPSRPDVAQELFFNLFLTAMFIKWHHKIEVYGDFIVTRNDPEIMQRPVPLSEYPDRAF